MKNWLLLFALIYGQMVFSQNILPIGAWQSHQPKRVGKFVTQSESEIFYSTRGAIMVLDKEEISAKFITRVDGLSGVDIRLLRYHNESETLIIVYQDGVIDLYKNGDIVTVNSIKNFTNINGVKTVNDIFIYDDKTLFLGGSYGISTFRVDNGSLPVTTFMGEATVNAVAVFEENVYAGTEEGIYRTSINNPNIDDFITWDLLGTEQGLPDDYSTSAMTIFENELYISINEDVYKFENELPIIFSDQDPTLNLHYMSAEGDYLLVGYRCNDGNVCGRGKVLFFSTDGNEGELTTACIGDTNGIIEDQYGRFWFGDNWDQFRYLENRDATWCKTFDYNGPWSSNVWDLEVSDDALWMATGAMTTNRTPLLLDAGMAAFVDRQWEIYNRWTKEAFKGFNTDPNFRDDDVFAVVDVEVNTTNQKIYGASYLTGLIEIDGENINLYNDTNSPLSNTINDEQRTRVSGLATDDDGNLWVSNYSPLEGKPLHRLAPDGTWVSFSETCGQNDLFQIAIDQNNYKWIIVGNSSAGLLLYDEGDINNLSDDRCRMFSISNSNLPTNETNCLVVDQDGDVWVGTNAGIIIFECGGAAFDDICQGSLRTVDLGGFLEHLFKTQAVQALAVDGANRKWVGTTTNGVYLISPDGKEELLHFTSDNSPLLDNFIRSIAINDRTGEVFFGTDKGVISYQSDATEGKRVNNKTPQVFPNPVRPDYEGPIAVKGLAVNANVKITDVNGKLVYETQALGGQVIWDGTDYNGRRVQTGVYLVFSTTNPREVGLAEPDAVVTKILFIN